MTVLSPVVVLAADTSGDDVLSTLATSTARTVVVVDGTGLVVGIADVDRLAAALTGRT